MVRPRMIAGRRGYTLIEMMVVILIITLIMALAVTRIDFLVPKYRLRAATRETASILKQARARAAATGRDVYVRIHLSEGTYELLVPQQKESTLFIPPDTPPELIPPPEYEFEALLQSRLPEETQFVNVILGSEPDQTITSGSALIRITPYGAGDHVLVNFQLEERRAAIRVNGLTGLVSFYEEEKTAPELLEDAGD